MRKNSHSKMLSVLRRLEVEDPERSLDRLLMALRKRGNYLYLMNPALPPFLEEGEAGRAPVFCRFSGN